MYVFCYHISGEIKLCIRRSVPSSVYHTLVVAMLQLDYCKAAPAAVPVRLLNGLQSVLGATVQSIAGLHRSAHITDTAASLHWLPGPE